MPHSFGTELVIGKLDDVIKNVISPAATPVGSLLTSVALARLTYTQDRNYKQILRNLEMGARPSEKEVEACVIDAKLGELEIRLKSLPLDHQFGTFELMGLHEAIDHAHMRLKEVL